MAAPNGPGDRTRRERLAIVVTSDLIGGHEMQLVHLARRLNEQQDVVIVATSPAALRFFADRNLDVRSAPFSASGKIWHQWRAAPALAAALRTVVGDTDAVLVSGGTIEACVAPARALKLLRGDRPIAAYIPMYVDRSLVHGAIGTAYNCASRMFTGAIDRFVTINRVQARLIASHYRRPVDVIRNTIAPLPPPSADHGWALTTHQCMVFFD